MGKMVGIYINNDEEKALDRFCQDHNCTSYSVLKAGLHFILDESCRRKQLEETNATVEKSEETPKKKTKKESDVFAWLFKDEEEETEENE